MTAQPKETLSPKSELPDHGLPVHPFCPRPEVREQQLSLCLPPLLTACLSSADDKQQPLALSAQL